MNDRTSEFSLCIGRFQFRAPTGFRVTGRHQAIYRTTVGTLTANVTEGQAIWEKKLAEIRRLKPVPGSALRVMELEPGTRVVWYAANSMFPAILTIEAMKLMPGHVLLVSRESDAGKEALAERLVREILRGYSPGNYQGFCVGHGSITLEPSQNEQARIALSSDSVRELEFKVETHTTRIPDSSTYADVEEESRLASASGGKLAVLRNQPRTVAGLPGRELWIRVEVPAEGALLRYTWHFQGVPGNSAQPVIDILGTARPEGKAALENAWETILASLRPTGAPGP
jgi:hypothetical protein